MSTKNCSAYLTAFLLCMVSASSIAETTTQELVRTSSVVTEKEMLREDAERVLLPAIQTSKYVLAKFAEDSREELSFELNFKVVAKGETEHVEAQFICPHEFGDACDLLIDAVLAFGGSCYDSLNNTVCDLP